MAPARPYQYIDLGADEVVGRRRTFKDNGFIAVRDSPDVVIEYQYIEEGASGRMPNTSCITSCIIWTSNAQVTCKKFWHLLHVSCAPLSETLVT